MLDPTPTGSPLGQSVQPNKDALDHAWRYFALHAAQRFSVFNFYIVLIGLTSAGLGVALQGSTRFAILGVILGFLIALLSLVFWKLDQRGSMLIKHSEQVLRALEPHVVGDLAAVFVKEDQQGQSTQWSWMPWKSWTFGQCLRRIFLVMGLFGLGSAVLCSLKATGVVSWEPATRAGNRLTCTPDCTFTVTNAPAPTPAAKLPHEDKKIKPLPPKSAPSHQ